MGKARRQSDGGIEPISRVIEEILGSGKLGSRTQVAQLWGQWKNIVGEDVAEHCTPEKIHDGKLYIKVESPVWQQQLDLMKEEIQEKINAVVQNESVVKLVFRQK